MKPRVNSTKRQLGMTLVELLVALAISSIIFTAIALMVFYSARSFAAVANYVDLDNFSRNALDVMCQEIRQADRLESGTEHEMVFRHTNPTSGASYTVTYRYAPGARTLVRIANGETRTLLQECDFLHFSIYQRNPIDGAYDYYETTDNPAITKIVQLSWICSREILGQRANTESVQSAKVVIRKQ